MCEISSWLVQFCCLYAVTKGLWQIGEPILTMGHSRHLSVFSSALGPYFVKIGFLWQWNTSVADQGQIQGDDCGYRPSKNLRKQLYSPWFCTITKTRYARTIQSFLYEGHTCYYTIVRGPDILHNVNVSRYVTFYQINKCFVNILFFQYSQKVSTGRMKRMAAGYGWRAVVWIPLAYAIEGHFAVHCFVIAALRSILHLFYSSGPVMRLAQKTLLKSSPIIPLPGSGPVADTVPW